MKSTPLPASLSGEVVERLIRVDKSLLPYIAGALQYAADREPYDQTGTLTVDQARELLGEMIWIFYTEQPQQMTPMIGEVRWLATGLTDAGWTWCDGTALSKTIYALLYEKIGDAFHTTAPETHFNIPDLRERFPVGIIGLGSSTVKIGSTGGEKEHTLITNEIPVHNHPPVSPYTTFLGLRTTGGGATVGAGTAYGGAATTGNTGGGQPHNNMPPWLGLMPFIYHGYLE